jgi:hypothetical protein
MAASGNLTNSATGARGWLLAAMAAQLVTAIVFV